MSITTLNEGDWRDWCEGNAKKGREKKKKKCYNREINGMCGKPQNNHHYYYACLQIQKLQINIC